MTSVDIARLAGVSRSTVSKVINNYPDVNHETREKVNAIIRQFGYTPNISARVLAGKKVQTLGLFFITGNTCQDDFTEDILADYMLACVAETASDNGYLTLISIIKTMDDVESVQRIKDMFHQGRIDAGIFIGCNNDQPILEELIEKGFILGVFDQNVPGKEEPNRIVVNFDDFSAEKAVDYLVSLGHTQIMGVHGELVRYNGVQKYNAFMNGVSKHGLIIRDEWMLFAGFSKNKAYKLFSDFLANETNLPTAIFCANDFIAYGVMEAIKAAGFSIPKDFSVIGIDDSTLSRYLHPTLTTFHVDFKEMLELLTLQVIKSVDELPKQHKKYEFSSQLIVRNSCRSI